MRNVKAILIDPFACTVTEVEHDADQYENIYKLISHEIHPIDTFAVVRNGILKDGEAIFVDDNGLLRNPVRFFQFAGYPQALAGKGLILGSDDEGDTIGATSQLATIKSAVMFAQVEGERLVQTTTPWQKADA